MSKILSADNENYEVFSTKNVHTAIEIALGHDIDLIICDWQMPDIQGIDAIAIFRRYEKLKNIPIILVSGILINDENLAEALNAGAADFVRKPIVNVEFIARVKSVLVIFENQKLEIEKKNKELATHAIYLKKHNATLSSIKKALNALKKPDYAIDNSAIETIDKIIKTINFHTEKDSWKRFAVYFDKIFPNFQTKLTQRFPELLPSELKIAVLLRMNLSTKEISEIISLQENTIKTTRYKLRQKFNLSKGESLHTFLSSL